MTALPTTAALTGPTVTEGQFKTALSDLRSFLAEQFGDTGVKADVLATLGAMLSKVIVRTTAYTVALTDRGAIIDGSGTWTLTLPTLASAGNGFAVIVDNRGSGTITADGNGSETIEGAATLAVAAGQSVLLVATTGTWMAVQFQGPVQSTAVDATSGRLLRLAGAFGSFGLGGTQSTLNANIDDVNLPSGIHYVQTALTSGTLPPGLAQGLLIQGQASQNTSRFPTQVVVSRDGLSMFFRGCSSASTWGAWQQIARIETGAWTPVVADAQTGGNVATTTIATGQYWAVGRSGATNPGFCMISAVIEGINTTGLTGANPLWIRGLPFPSINITAGRFLGSVSLSSVTFAGVPQARLLPNASALQILLSASGAGRSNLTVAGLTSGTAAIELTLTYGL